MLKSIFLQIYLLIPVTAFASVPEPWQMDLQKPAGVIAEMATDLHNFLLVVITLISLFVLKFHINFPSALTA